jgi:hypothetical protein
MALVEHIAPGRNGVFRNTIVSRGRVVGSWRKTRRARSTAVAVEIFSGRVPAAKLSRALDLWARFAATDIDVSVTRVGK